MRANDFVQAPWRFWAHVSRTDECWEWQGATARNGYGVVRNLGRQWKAHRLALLLTNGSLDESKFVCHRCDNPRCVRPDHLYEGTATDNNRDTVKRQRRAPPKTHCKRGHEFTPENTWDAHPSAGVVHGRRCRICTLALNKQSQERRGHLWYLAEKRTA